MGLSKLAGAVLLLPVFAVQPSEVSAQHLRVPAQVRPHTVSAPIYEITEIINDPDRLSEPGIAAYYKVNTKGDFYITHNTDSTFSLAYRSEDITKGLLFPEKAAGQLVGIVDAASVGFPGGFEIRSAGKAAYSVNYASHIKSSVSLLHIPTHTQVSSTYAKNMISAIKSLPEPFTSELAKQGITVMIAKDYNDAYYYYYPSWKEYDRWKTEDPAKPPYEITPKGYVDNRKYSSTGGFFIDKKAVIPQIVTQYGTCKLVDRSDSKDYIVRVLYHELGHALDYAYSSAFSDSDSFKSAHALDVKSFSDEDKKNLVYFYNSRSEAFAHLTAALLGGLSKDEAAVMLSKFKRSAEIIREDVLPRIGVNISVEDIRKNIYPDYNRKAPPVKTSQVISIPDMPRDLVPQLA